MRLHSCKQKASCMIRCGCKCFMKDYISLRLFSPSYFVLTVLCLLIGRQSNNPFALFSRFFLSFFFSLFIIIYFSLFLFFLSLCICILLLFLFFVRLLEKCPDVTEIYFLFSLFSIFVFLSFPFFPSHLSSSFFILWLVFFFFLFPSKIKTKTERKSFHTVLYRPACIDYFFRRLTLNVECFKKIFRFASAFQTIRTVHICKQ